MILASSTLGFALIASYFIILVLVGLYARSKSKGSLEDYFLASRSFKTGTLFFTILATISSAFMILGFPGQVYRTGLANWGWFAAIGRVVGPVVLGTIALRMWYASTEFDLITPGEYINHRYESNYLGQVLSFLMMFWTIPYLVLGGIGGGVAFESLTNGMLSFNIGAALVISMVALYLLLGGMRGSGYTDIIQGIIMLTVLASFAFLTVNHLGGIETAMTAPAEEAGMNLLSRAEGFSTGEWASGIIIYGGFAMIMLPHVLLRIFSSSSGKALRGMTITWNVANLFFVLFATLLGYWGRAIVPGLEGQAADYIIPKMMGVVAPEYVTSIALLVILAAIMSSLDSQAFSYSTLISEDFLSELTDMGDQKILSISKVLTVAVLILVFGLTIIKPGTIFFLVKFAFQGYGLLTYPVVVGLYWRKSTEAGVLAGLLYGFSMLWLFQLNILPSALTFGFLPVVPIMASQILVVHLVSHFTEAPSEKRINRYFRAFRGLW